MKMIRTLLPLLIAFTVGMFGTQWLTKQTEYDVGEVVVRLAGNDYSTGLPQTAILLILLAMLLWLLWTCIKTPFSAWKSYRQKQDLNRLTEGLRNAELGHWQRAEHLLLTASKAPAVKSVALTAAIRCADRRQDTPQAEALAQQLAAIDPLLYALSQSERLLNQGKTQNTLDILESVKQDLPPRGEWMRTQALAQAGQTQEAYDQLEMMRQHATISEANAKTIEHQIAEQTLEQAENMDALNEHWDNLTEELKNNADLVQKFAQRACAMGAELTAQKQIEQTLNTQMHEALVLHYAKLPRTNVQQRIDYLLQKLNQHPQNTAILTALAQLYNEEKQYETAQDMAKRALQEGSGALAWEALGTTWLETGHPLEAAYCFINSLHRQRGESIITPLSNIQR